MLYTLSTLCGALIFAAGPQIKGDYVEARNADVYTGPCFSNAEVFIAGDRAVVAWKITEGTYEGQNLKGLSVAAAIKGTTTFSKDVAAEATSVVIVDHLATPAQREALIHLAKDLAGDRLKNITEIKTGRIQLTVEDMTEPKSLSETSSHHSMPQAPRAALYIPNTAEILTRPFEVEDHSCGNEVVEYAPLSKGVTAQPAYTLAHTFKGKALNSTWNDPNCRSSFVGHFAR